MDKSIKQFIYAEPCPCCLLNTEFQIITTIIPRTFKGYRFVSKGTYRVQCTLCEWTEIVDGIPTKDIKTKKT